MTILLKVTYIHRERHAAKEWDRDVISACAKSNSPDPGCDIDTTGPSLKLTIPYSHVDFDRYQPGDEIALY